MKTDGPFGSMVYMQNLRPGQTVLKRPAELKLSVIKSVIFKRDVGCFSSLLPFYVVVHSIRKCCAALSLRRSKAAAKWICLWAAGFHPHASRERSDFNYLLYLNELQGTASLSRPGLWFLFRASFGSAVPHA